MRIPTLGTLCRRPFQTAFMFGLAATALCAFASTASAAQIVVVNQDGPREGFNDLSPRAPVGGNPGTTLGAQRLNAFRFAAHQWELRLESEVTIVVGASMDPMFCSSTSATLGGAGTAFVYRDFPGALFANTWYPGALADRLAGYDLNPGNVDISATFNSALDSDPRCLSGVNWYYGFDDAPSGMISFVDVVLHELAHGLGVQTFVNPDTGDRFAGKDDVFMKFLEDHDSGLMWTQMTNAQRAASAVDTGHLHWVGPAVGAQSSILANGAVGRHVRMYAPDPVEPGSSLSHWSTDLSSVGPGYDELMEPFATSIQAMLVTDELLQDIGWNAFGGGSCAPASPPDNVTVTNEVITGTAVYEACDTLATENFVKVGRRGNATFRAGRQIVLRPGFAVALGGEFTATIEPYAFE